MSHSSNTIEDSGAGDYHYRHGNVLEIDFDFCYGYYCGYANSPCDSNKVSMKSAENGQCYCCFVNYHASEHVQDV